MKNKALLTALSLIFVASLSLGSIFIVDNMDNSSSNISKDTKNSVTISTVDTTKVGNKNNNNQTTDVTNSTTSVSNSKQTTKSTSSIKTQTSTQKSSVESNNTKPGSSSNSNSTSVSSSGNSQTEISLQQSNINKIQSINSKLGVLILTGSDADIWDSGTKCYGLKDEKLISEWLDIIQKELSRYPNGFFRDFNDITTFKIRLLEYIPNKQGFASYEIATDMFIAINTDSKTSGFPTRTLNHEIMHIIDKYIYFKCWNDVTNEYESPLEQTANYIPPGFSWGSTSDNSYTIYDSNVSNRYFVSAYAKTNSKEDRAETFADYMFRTYKRDYMQDKSTPIPSKQAIIAKAIRDNFPSAARTSQGSLPWERWL